METKVCNKCEIEKEITEYHKNGKRYYSICKSCKRESRLANYENESKIRKVRDKRNAEHIREQKREYQKNSLVYKSYRESEERKEYMKEYNKLYYLENKESINEQKREYILNKRRNDNLYRFKDNLRGLIYRSITRNGYNKDSISEEILGCSYEEFIKHIESQFEDWMNWDNYGNPEDGIVEPNKTWDIDHITPTSSAINESEVIKLNHFTNLQPLCSYVNRFVKRHY